MSRVLKICSRRALVGILEIAMIVLLGTTPPVLADPSTEQAERIRSELQTVGEEYLAAYNRHDAAAVASFSTENSELIKWSGEFVRGKDNIQKFFEQTFKDNPNLQVQNSFGISPYDQFRCRNEFWYFEVRWLFQKLAERQQICRAVAKD